MRVAVDLFRIHRAGQGPWWFSSDGSGRFDIAPPGGTCYLSLSPLGAFVEVFRSFEVANAHDLTTRRLSRLHPPRNVVLADCTSPRTRMFGITAAIHSTDAYEITQSWAAAWRAGGFDGVRYFCGHDRSQSEVGIALFGDAGDAGLEVADIAPVGGDLLVDIERRFGIQVVPSRKPSE